MAWTAPRTWTADYVVQAADMNLELRDNLNVLVVPIDTATGKISALSSATLANLSGTNLTGVGLLAAVNTWTEKNTFNSGNGRVVLPNGADKWAT